MKYQKGISKNTFRCDACGKIFPYSLYGGVITNPFTSKSVPQQTQKQIARHISPLEWKTLYPICISCIKIFDNGFDAHFFDRAVETQIIDKLKNRFHPSFFILSHWTDEFGKATAGMLEPNSFRPMNFCRPINMLRVKVIRLFNKAKEKEKQKFLEQPQVFIAKFYQESKED
jgi:hypothetical protein